MAHLKKEFILKVINYSHISVNPSVPTILRPGFKSLAQQLCFFQFVTELQCEKYKNNK